VAGEVPIKSKMEATMAEVAGPPYKDAASVPKGRPTPTQDELNRGFWAKP